MKKIILLPILLSTLSFAGGDYGGGPKILEFHKLDHTINLGDVKLSRDKEFVEVLVTYQKRRTEFNPFVGEKEAQKLLFGKYASFTVKYQREVIDQTLI